MSNLTDGQVYLSCDYLLKLICLKSWWMIYFSFPPLLDVQV